MNIINTMLNLLKKALQYKEIWIFFPFTIAAFALGLVFLILACCYMLIDLMVYEFRKELERGNDKAGVLAIAFKYLIAYSVYICFEITRITMLLPLAILYFFTNIFLFVSSLGKVREYLFAFHNL